MSLDNYVVLRPNLIDTNSLAVVFKGTEEEAYTYLEGQRGDPVSTQRIIIPTQITRQLNLSMGILKDGVAYQDNTVTYDDLEVYFHPETLEGILRTRSKEKTEAPILFRPNATLRL